MDQRTLIITFAGGLAANLVTVILVGGALAFVHLSKHHGSRLLGPALIVVIAGLVGIVGGNVLRRFRAYPGSPYLTYGWMLVTAGWLVELFGLMILTGLAAGVK